MRIEISQANELASEPPLLHVHLVTPERNRCVRQGPARTCGLRADYVLLHCYFSCCLIFLRFP